MSFRLPVLPAVDGRVHREEEITFARLASHRQRLGNDLIASSSPEEQSTGNGTMGTAPPVLVPTSVGRRRVVLPDPVAFRSVLLSIQAAASQLSAD